MRRVLAAALCLTLLCLAFGSTDSAQAQAYPTKPILIVVSVPAGGSIDVQARMIGQQLSETLKQPVVIENRPGANGIIAARAVAGAPADGHTLFLSLDTTLTLNPHIYASLPYDPEKDFAPISLVSTSSLLMVTNPKTPFRTVKELIAHAKANPGKLNYGTGTPLGLAAGTLFASATDTRMIHVPFRGADPAILGLRRGDVDLVFGSFASAINLVKQGELFALATTDVVRSRSVPDVPTMKELGFAMELTAWTGLFAPAGTPAAVIDLLNREVLRILGNPETADRLRSAIISEPVTSTPAELAARQKADTAKWQVLAKAAGIKAE